MSRFSEVKLAAEKDLAVFIKLVAPHRMLGSIHHEVIRWWAKDRKHKNSLLLLPRGHQKSVMMAYRVAWRLTRHPHLTFLYISATANLAEKQLGLIKSILTSDIYRHYWSEMTNVDEGKREKWAATEIIVDHPARKKEGVRDPSVFTGGLTTNLIGLHCDIAVLDDVVVDTNAYTGEGRSRVLDQYSGLASIENAESEEWVCGTRYHPKDLYQAMMDNRVEMYDTAGTLVSQEPLFDVFNKVVEDRGDGTGEYIWPRRMRSDGKYFGFNQEILMQKKAKYESMARYHSQYYNNPNAPGEEVINRDKFQYYNPKYLEQNQGYWFYNGNRLNVVAAIDFAFSLSSKADYTVICVVGIDKNYNYYVLGIYRFKTKRIADYYTQVYDAHTKWGFRKLRAEISVAQDVIVEDLIHSYIRPNGLSLSIDKFRPMAKHGTKEERILAALQGKYDNMQVWHKPGGMSDLLEEELVLAKPAHDDIKDALASAITVAKPPGGFGSSMKLSNRQTRQVSHSRFGGVMHHG